MVMLLEQDLRTKEVLHWKGIHLLHFAGSSCSQKTRIVLGLKGVEWASREVNLATHENYGDWFMGINPRGLVPVLVHDGRVIIESNDILSHLEAHFPEPALIPAGREAELTRLLEQEDDLHLDLRAICFRYFFPNVKPRPPALQARYAAAGAGTVGGEPDSHKARELKFHAELRADDGVSDARIRAAVERFAAAFAQLDARLVNGPHLLGEHLSLLDIAWYIYAYRLAASGYPLHERHAALGAWFEQLHGRDEFRREVAEPPPLVAMREAMHGEQQERGDTLPLVAGL